MLPSPKSKKKFLQLLKDKVQEFANVKLNNKILELMMLLINKFRMKFLMFKKKSNKNNLLKFNKKKINKKKLTKIIRNYAIFAKDQNVLYFAKVFADDHFIKNVFNSVSKIMLKNHK